EGAVLSRVTVKVAPEQTAAKSIHHERNDVGRAAAGIALQDHLRERNCTIGIRFQPRRSCGGIDRRRQHLACCDPVGDVQRRWVCGKRRVEEVATATDLAVKQRLYPAYE